MNLILRGIIYVVLGLAVVVFVYNFCIVWYRTFKVIIKCFKHLFTPEMTALIKGHHRKNMKRYLFIGASFVMMILSIILLDQFQKAHTL